MKGIVVAGAGGGAGSGNSCKCWEAKWTSGLNQLYNRLLVSVALLCVHVQALRTPLALTVPAWPRRGSPTLPAAQDPIVVPSGLSVPAPAVPQRGAGLQLPTALPSPDMGPAKPVPWPLPVPMACLAVLGLYLAPVALARPEPCPQAEILAWPWPVPMEVPDVWGWGCPQPALPPWGAPMATSAPAPRELLVPTALPAVQMEGNGKECGVAVSCSWFHLGLQKTEVPFLNTAALMIVGSPVLCITPRAA